MCQGFPAPRCSRHAWNLYTAAVAELDNADSQAATELAERKVRKAAQAFYMTPAGFAHLEEAIKNEKDVLKQDALYAELFAGKKRRRDSIFASRRIARENKQRLENVKNMRLLSIPVWSIAGQLNVEFLEAQGFTVEKTVDTVNKCFVLNVTDANGKSEKVLSLSNKHYLELGQIGKTFDKFDSIHPLASIADAFNSRGSNSPVDFDELTPSQKKSLTETVVSNLKNAGFSKVIFCNPSLGYSEIVNVEDVVKFYTLTYLTPKAGKTGTDNIPAKYVDEFVSQLQHSMVGTPQKVDTKTVVELEEQVLNPDELYVGSKFFLSHLKDNFYMVKKLGKVNKYNVRVMLNLVDSI